MITYQLNYHFSSKLASSVKIISSFFSLRFGISCIHRLELALRTKWKHWITRESTCTFSYIELSKVNDEYLIIKLRMQVNVKCDYYLHNLEENRIKRWKTFLYNGHRKCHKIIYSQYKSDRYKHEDIVFNRWNGIFIKNVSFQ